MLAVASNTFIDISVTLRADLDTKGTPEADRDSEYFDPYTAICCQHGFGKIMRITYKLQRC
ncbi:hypothetical protein LTR62_005699 [Meristemomyces frigidus]|uniref:Uncharacterized protein n=1 Tax=Meristemomyces frigidus TaxID=1508187 RepID=A0AAN7YF43_9PEZI|nr:hypothetical protein LTR62_005699 [Meristemomyces frigidus]